MKRKSLLQIAMLSIVLLMSLTVTAFATTQTFDVPSNRNTSLRWTLKEGITVIGTVTLNGTLRFYAKNPHADTIFDQELISQSASFNFTTTEAGDYTLYFDNSGGGTAKSVTVSYDTGAPLSPLFTVALIVFVVSLVGLVVFVYWYRKKSKSNLGQDSPNDS